ncbi:protein of unknown function DUF871 [Coriobacterium glomerans PW2]|uniref:Outer surface protein n=1 Tax=Coriobacterium glomerans (strain ATCC 49209 / DSM 20642 / JCM 10262 / PW2) TaxID=700015 RepID=F2N9Q3_CORGP|nr:MupG family TIM beta-alpha barrel fold protein [Coriobacterium glomerans]AEB07156.1 protein of unknown function DUF871 [Coriobacterium glomerans PW2]
MHRLGISVYPQRSTPERDEQYMKLAASYGFTRIFTCLLSADTAALDTFGSFTLTAHELGFVVAVDTNETVFDRLGATPCDLSPFKRLGIDIIRLDAHFGDCGDIAITRNRERISIEFNGSAALALDNLIERGADPHAMRTCHNFYPEPYTGLSEEAFTRLSMRYRNMGLGTAAFISSRQPDTFGPWPVFAGLPTCEDDRHRPAELQARHLFATELADDVIFGNAFASEEELASVAAVDQCRSQLGLVLESGVSPVEREVIWGASHATRGDASAYMLRSSMPRLAFRDRSIAARPSGVQSFKRGDVLVVNDNMEHYRGELEIALREIPDDGTRNLVGAVPPEELFLLDYIAPEHLFGFKRC